MAMTFDEQETFIADASWIAKTKQAMTQTARAIRRGTASRIPRSKPASSGSRPS